MGTVSFVVRCLGFMYLVIGGTLAFCAFGYYLLHIWGGWGVGLFCLILPLFIFLGTGIAEWYDRVVMHG